MLSHAQQAAQIWTRSMPARRQIYLVAALGGALAGLILALLGVPALMALPALLARAPGLLGYGVSDLRAAGGPDMDQDALPAGTIDYTTGE